jgi:hypothetical protein
MKILVVAMGLLTTTTAMADPIWQVRREPGLVCMTMPNKGTAIHSEHFSAARIVGYADSIVFMLLPRRSHDGFTEIERPNRETGWVAEKDMKPQADCTPMVMSDGSIKGGF